MQQSGNNPAAPYHQPPTAPPQQQATDPLLEQDLRMSGEPALWRGSGKPSVKQMIGPFIVVIIGFVIMFLIVSASPAPPAALVGVIVAACVFITLLLAATISALNTVYYLAVTPTRVICVRRGGCCGPVTTVVAFVDMVQIRVKETPPGCCCAPGPTLLIDTPASVLLTALNPYTTDGNGHTRRRDEPALSVTVTNPITIHEMRRAIESARGAIPGLPPLSVLHGTQAVSEPQPTTAFLSQLQAPSDAAVVYPPVAMVAMQPMVPSSYQPTHTPMAAHVAVAMPPQYAPAPGPQYASVPQMVVAAAPPYGHGAPAVGGVIRFP